MSAHNVEKLWKDLSGALRAFIASRVPSTEDADDILQEVFIKVHGKVGTLRERDKLEPWVYQIARNAIADHYRRRKPTTVLPTEVKHKDPEVVEDLDRVAAGWLSEMAEGLPEKYRQALELVELQGLPQKELSRRLGISLSGAKSRVQRAREGLKQALLDCCHFEFDRRGKIVDYKRRADCCPPEKSPRRKLVGKTRSSR